MNGKHKLTPYLICKPSSLDYHHKQSWKILKASWSENLKFSIANTVLTSTYPTTLWSSPSSGFLSGSFKVKREMMTKSSTIKWLRWIYRSQVQETVPNILISLRLFLTLIVSVATAERSFSKLKLIKSYLRSIMTQDRLFNLSHISIEHETVENINLTNLSVTFAFAKVRKVKIW